MDKNLYNYKAKLIKVVDGDTVDIEIDLGFDIHINQRVRLYNINTPETRTTNLLEKEAGLKVKWLLENLLLDKDIYVKTIKSNDKFGRYLADIIFARPTDLELISVSEYLVENNFAKQYDGSVKKEDWSLEELRYIMN